MNRLPYIIWTGVLLAVSNLALRMVLIAADGQMGVFPDAWQFLDPFRLFADGGTEMWLSIGIHVALTIGLVLLSTRRASDAGWNRWLGLLMILPVVRLFVFTALAVVPGEAQTNALDLPRRAWLDRILPRRKL